MCSSIFIWAMKNSKFLNQVFLVYFITGKKSKLQFQHVQDQERILAGQKSVAALFGTKQSFYFNWKSLISQL